MIFTPNTNPTEIDFNDETGVVSIAQRVFGSDRVNTISLKLDDLKEFMETLA